MLRRKSSFAIILLLSLFSISNAQLFDFQPETLKGLPSVRVVSISIDDDLKNIVHKEFVKTDIELFCGRLAAANPHLPLSYCVTLADVDSDYVGTMHGHGASYFFNRPTKSLQHQW